MKQETYGTRTLARFLIKKNTCIIRILFLILECGTFYSGTQNVFLEGNSAHGAVEMVTTNEFLDNCITARNAHGEEDEGFTKIFPQGISEDEKGRALLKPYLANE